MELGTSLAGWTVLVPRAKKQAGSLCAKLRNCGALPCDVPTIEIKPPTTRDRLERAAHELVEGRYAWVVFTSANAVDALGDVLCGQGFTPPWWDNVNIACIGNATADMVRSGGVHPHLVPGGDYSSEGLLGCFPRYDSQHDQIGRVLLPQANIADPVLATGLAERGWTVDAVTAYHTVLAPPPPASIRTAVVSGDIDAVVFTSSSTVRNLIALVGKPHERTVIAVIGPKTGQTAREWGLHVAVVAARPTVSALVEALVAYATQTHQG